MCWPGKLVYCPGIFPLYQIVNNNQLVLILIFWFVGQAQGHLLVLSGKTSSVLSQVPTPNYESIFSQPQILVRPDGENVLLYTTGSVDSPGGLYAVSLHHLVMGNITQVLEPLVIS